jgi:hypothetical protein
VIEYERKVLLLAPLYAVGRFIVEPVVDYFPPGDGRDFGVRYRVQGEEVYRALAGEAVASELTIKSKHAKHARYEQTHKIPPMVLSPMPATVKVRATMVRTLAFDTLLFVDTFSLHVPPGISVTIDTIDTIDTITSAKAPHVLEVEALFDEVVDPAVAARVDAIADALVKRGAGRWRLPSDEEPAPRYCQIAKVMPATTDYEAPLRASVEEARRLLSF